MKHTILFLSIVLGFIASCEKEIPLTTEESDPKLVLNGVINKDDSILVELTRSKTIVDNSNNVIEPVQNANIFIRDEAGNEIGKFQPYSEAFYILTTPGLEVTKTYEIIANHPDYPSVSAISSIPEKIIPTKVDTATNTKGEFSINISAQDLNGIKNFYGFRFELGIYDTLYQTHHNFGGSFSSTSPYLENSVTEFENIGGAVREFLFTDQAFDGDPFDFEVLIDHIFYPGGQEKSYCAYQINALSEELFKYKITQEKYEETSGNPFAEPVRVYSNIENGLGIFGGENYYRDTIWFDK